MMRAAIETFARDGVVMIPGFLPDDVVARMADEGWRSARPLMAGDDPGGLRTQEWPGGPLRIYDLIDGPVPTAAAFFDHPFVAEFAERTTTVGMHVLDEYLDVKYEIDGPDTNVVAHFDQWKVRLKFFLLLSDVGDEQAPFVYYSGSHRPGRWRERADKRVSRTGFAKFPAARVAAVQRREGFQRRVFTGRAGDLVIADTRGLHAGSVLRSGERLLAVRLYGMNGPQSWAC